MILQKYYSEKLFIGYPDKLLALPINEENS